MWEGREISLSEQNTGGTEVSANGGCAVTATRQHVASGHINKDTISGIGKRFTAHSVN